MPINRCLDKEAMVYTQWGTTFEIAEIMGD